MKTILFFLPAFFANFFLCCVFAQEPEPMKWEGTLQAPNYELKMVFEFQQQRCLLTVPAQALADYPSSTFTSNGDTLNASFTGLFQAGFRGIRQSDTVITGHWMQSGVIIPLVLRPKKENLRPQNPKPPYPYIVQELTYTNRDSSITFGATLAVPHKGKKLAAAILISGSGQQDRDETVFGHKPFWVIADYLARQGIAVLRVDDRGVGATTGRATLKDATTRDFANDVAAGIEYLKRRPEIDSTKIGLIGHSEGGMIAALVSAERNDVAFVVSLAGLGVTGRQIIASQLELALNQSFSKQDADSILLFEMKCIDIILRQSDNLAAETEILNMLNSEWVHKQDETVKKYFGMEEQNGVEVYQTQLLKQRNRARMSPWFRYFLAYDPAPVLPQIKAPFLAVNGNNDTQVAAEPNLSGFINSFTQCGKTNYKTVCYQGLNHFFQHCTTGMLGEVEGIEETFSEEVMRDMAQFIKRETAK